MAYDGYPSYYAFLAMDESACQEGSIGLKQLENSGKLWDDREKDIRLVFVRFVSRMVTLLERGRTCGDWLRG